MNFDLQSEIEEIQKKVRTLVPESEFQFWLRSDWKQDQTDYRLQIRKFAASLPGHASYESEICDLSKPFVKVPLKSSEDFQDQTAYYSISHSSQLGTLVKGAVPLGVDLELIDRVADRIVSRVSTPEEFKKSPSPAHLWTAKEAVYKTLYHFRQPQVVSQFEISNWQPLQENTFSFNLKDPETFSCGDNKGLVFVIHSHALAVFFANP